MFRPPYGVTNPSLKKAIKDFNFYTIGWSIRSFDTVKSIEQTLDRVKKRLSPGDIILFHDNRENIIEILNSLLKYIESENYKVFPLDELLNIQAYE